MKRLAFFAFALFLVFAGCRKGKVACEPDPQYYCFDSTKVVSVKLQEFCMKPSIALSDNGDIMLTVKDYKYNIVTRISGGGNIIWIKTKDTIGFDGIYRVSVDKFVIATPLNAMFVDLNGNMWNSSVNIGFGGNEVLSDGSYVVISTTVYPHNCIRKYEFTGSDLNFLWETCDTTYRKAIQPIFPTITKHGAGYVATYEPEAPVSFAVYKVDSNGNFLWSRGIILDTVIGAFVNAGVEAYDGGLVFVGKAVQRHTSEDCPLIVKLDSLGNLKWYRCIRKPFDNEVWGGPFKEVVRTPDGQYFAFGEVATCGSGYCIIAVKFDDEGNITLLRNYWSPLGASGLYDAKVSNDGVIYFTTCIDNLSTAAILKVDKDGNVLDW
ncbi:MAG: hypothetical protein ABIL16_06970 [candidate division WOR-3 bacterium]